MHTCFKTQGPVLRKQCLKESGSRARIIAKSFHLLQAFFLRKCKIPQFPNPSGTSTKSSLLFLSKLIMHFPYAVNQRHDEIGPRRTAWRDRQMQTGPGSRTQSPGSKAFFEMFPCYHVGLMLLKVRGTRLAPYLKSGEEESGSLWTTWEMLEHTFYLKAQRSSVRQKFEFGRSSPIDHFQNMLYSSSSWLLYFVSGIQFQIFRIFFISPFVNIFHQSSNYEFNSNHTSSINLFFPVPCHHTSLCPYDYLHWSSYFYFLPS